MYDDTRLTREIYEGAARAFFASAYVDQAEEAGEPLSAGDVVDQLPEETDPEALKAAERLIMGLLEGNMMWVGALYLRHKGGLDTRTWGHYAAMEAMGHGVGLWEYVEGVKVPEIEFTGLHLDRNYFQPTG